MVLVEKDEDPPLVLGTLTRGVCDQFKTDLMVGGGDLIRLSHTGKKCEVHVTGFKQEDIFDSDEDEDDFEMQEMFDGEPTEEEQKKLRASIMKKLKEDPEISSDEEDESDDMDFDEDSDRLSTESDSDPSDDDDEVSSTDTLEAPRLQSASGGDVQLPSTW